MLSLTWDQARTWRLARSHLVEPAPRERLTGVVGDVCGIQAQVMVAAELALSARVAGLTQQEVRDELWVRRTLVKTYGPRGTLHLLPSSELRTWVAAMRAIRSHHGAIWNALSDVTQDQVEELIAATRGARRAAAEPRRARGGSVQAGRSLGTTASYWAHG